MKKGLKVMSVVGLAAVSLGAASALVACHEKEKETKKEVFRIWAAEGVIDDVARGVDEFIATFDVVDADGEVSNEFRDAYEINYASVSEANAATNLTTDVNSAASVFYFPQDQLSRLITANVIEKVSTTYASDVKARNDSSSVEAATVDGSLWAYPATSDNGFFLYYDATALDEWVANSTYNTSNWTAEQVLHDQTKLIQVAQDLNLYIGFQITNDGGWYNAGYFMATGCESVWDLDASGGFYEAGVHDTYNTDAGVIAMKGMYELLQSGVWVGSSDASGTLSANGLAVVSGTWDYNNAVEALAVQGHELGCTVLPTFTVDGTEYQIGSFSGFKMVGTKPEDDAVKNAWAQSIANYLTGEEFQKLMLDNHGWGPSNSNAQGSIDYTENPQLEAFFEQMNLNSAPQGNYPDDWWTWASDLGAAMYNAASGLSGDALTAVAKDALATYAQYIDDYFNSIF